MNFERNSQNNSGNDLMQLSNIPKSKLNLLNQVREFGMFLDKSTNYWKDAVENTVCDCTRDESILKKELEKSKNQPSIFRVIPENPDKNKKQYSKEWEKEEIDTLLHNYYTLKIKNWKKLSQIIQTKSAQQCCYKIKKLEEKSKMKNFTRQDDIKLIELVDKYDKNWEKIAENFSDYSPEVLEERYNNKLDPKLKRTKFSQEEDNKILSLYNKVGNNWKEIASHFPDRNANMIKNRFYSFLKKKNNIKSNSSCSNSAGSYVETSSMVLSNDLASEPINSEINSEPLPFKYNDETNDLNNKYEMTSIDMKMNSLFVDGHYMEGDSLNEEHQDDSFVETYQKVFPNQPKKDIDFDDSGSSSNNVMIGKIKVSSNSDDDNDNLPKGHNTGNLNGLNLVRKDSQHKKEQTQKLFNESKRLKEILEKIDNFQENEPDNIPLDINDEKYQEFLTKKNKIEKYKSVLHSKLNMLLNEYNNQQNQKGLSTNTLLEINEVLLKLISISKLKMMINKKLNDIIKGHEGVHDGDVEMEGELK